MPMSSLVWGAKIYNWSRPTISEQVCGSKCFLWNFNLSCDFFVFVDKTCFLGNLSHNEGFNLMDKVYHGTPIILKGGSKIELHSLSRL